MVSGRNNAENFASVINTAVLLVENPSLEIRICGIVEIPLFVLHIPHNLLLLWVKSEQIIIEFKFRRSIPHQILHLFDVQVFV